MVMPPRWTNAKVPFSKERSSSGASNRFKITEFIAHLSQKFVTQQGRDKPVSLFGAQAGRLAKASKRTGRGQRLVNASTCVISCPILSPRSSSERPPSQAPSFDSEGVTLLVLHLLPSPRGFARGGCCANTFSWKTGRE